jgi:hypothetical protein
MRYRIQDQYGDSWEAYNLIKAIYSWIILSVFYRCKALHLHWKIYKLDKENNK